MVSMMLVLLAAMSLGLLIYALATKSKAILSLAIALCVLSVMAAWLIRQASMIRFLL